MCYRHLWNFENTKNKRKENTINVYFYTLIVQEKWKN